VRALAHAALADVGLRTGVAVVARRVVVLDRVRAHPGGRIAFAEEVTLILHDADHRIAALADAALAGIGLRASVIVRADRAVRLFRVRAQSRRRIARSRIVTLILRGAHDRRFAD